jgi:ParB family chromosome partitioning protein
VNVERGLVRADNAKALKALQRKRTTASSNADETGLQEASRGGAEPRRVPAKLLEELLAHKSLGLRVAIVDAPDLALRLVGFSLAAAFIGDASASCLSIKVEDVDVARSITRAQSKAGDAFAAIASAWRTRLPNDPAALWRYIAALEQKLLLELIAVATASGIDLRRNGPLSGMEARQALGQSLCDAAGLDMTRYWTASIDSYFAHIRKDATIDALMEVAPKLERAVLAKASKQEVLVRAKRSFKKGAWLPVPLRTAPQSATLPIAAA